MSCGYCDVCHRDESIFWHPLAYGIDGGPNRIGALQCQFITMCDDCYIDFIKWCKEHKNIHEIKKEGGI